MRLLLTIIILFCFFKITAQERDIKISIEFNNINKKQIIKLLEDKTDYRFFYLEDWLDNKRIEKKFDQVSITTILNAVFEQSTVNYFITDDFKIILTNGSLIRRPNYTNQKLTDDENSSTPIILKTTDKSIYSIGKEQSERKATYLLKGYIKSINTNKPLEGVTVFERKKNISSITDNNGYYQLILPYGKNFIETSSMEYSSNGKSIIMYNDGDLNLKLDQKAEELDEITIYTSIKKNVKQTVSGITEIKAEDIKTIPQILGERDILKAVTTLPGVKAVGEGAEGVNVRGGKVDQNLFLLDEGVMYNPTHFLGLFSAINPFTTSDLKLYKGSMPSEYGGRLSSVFDIHSKNASVEKVKGEVSIGPVTGNISIETPIIKEKSGLLLGVRSTYSNWILKTINNEDLQNSSISFHDFIGKYNHKINENNSLKLTGYYSKDKFKIASDSINSYSNKVFTLNWKHKFNDKNIAYTSLTNSNYGFKINYDNDSNRSFDLNYTINESSFKFKMDYLFSIKHKLNYGLELKKYEISPGSLSPGNEQSSVTPINIAKEKGMENGIFISDEWLVNKKLSFNLGLRYSQFLALGSSNQRIYEDNVPKNPSSLVNTINHENNEIYKTYHGLSYRLSGRYSINNDLSVKASINNAFQYIHRLSTNTTASPLDTWRLTDANLKPQEGTQFSLGIFKNINANSLELSLEGYYKKYENLMDYKTGASLLLNETIETEILQGPGKSYGYELLLNKKSGALNGWIGYSYARSFIKLDSDFNEEKINNGNYFSTNYDKPHNLDIVLNYKLTERYSISTNFTYQTGRPITYPDGKYIYQNQEYLTYSDRNEFRIPDYYRLDVGLNIEGNHKIKKFAHSFWNISVYNLLGRNNPYSVFLENVDGQVSGYKKT